MFVALVLMIAKNRTRRNKYDGKSDYLFNSDN